MKKFALAGVVGKPVTSTFSHNGGWTNTLKSILESKFNTEIALLSEKDDWNEYDVLFLTEGVNFKPGSFNFFGGVQPPQIERLRMLNEYKGRVISLSGELDYNIVMQKRKELAEYDWTFEIPQTLDLLKTSDKLVLGDSHSISVYKEGHTISRNDGKTLKGFLNKGLQNYVPDNMKELIFYAGNIDVRFHIFNPNRPGTPKEKIQTLIDKLGTELLSLNLDKVTCVKLIPIESEDRKIPGTGQLDKKNFYGSFEQRQAAVKMFNTELQRMCEKNGFDILTWNFDYDQELDFGFMEARQSVHLRPTAYFDHNYEQTKLF